MYSQGDEETYIAGFFAGRNDGRFLDIGAGDGRTFSNTLALYERGWKGCCADASPVCTAKLLDRFGDDAGMQIINALIAPEPGWACLHEASGDGISTVSAKFRERWQAATRYRPLFMPATTIHDLLDFAGDEFDFINIDLEGVSAAVFFQMEIPKRVSLLCIEHDDRRGEIAARLAPLGFRLIFENDENVIYGRR